jgi:hypothetical protein
MLNRRRFLAAIAAAPIVGRLVAKSAAPVELPPIVATPLCYSELIPIPGSLPATGLAALEPYIRELALAAARQIEQDLLAFYDRHYPLAVRGDVYTFRPPFARRP